MTNHRIEHKFFYESAPDIVWEYLTNPDLMALWLMKSNFKPELGHEFQFQGPKMPDVGWDGIFYCKVLEIKPYTRLSYTWNGGPGDGSFNLESVVTFSLQAVHGGTELLLEHVGNRVDYPLIFTNMDKGWLGNIRKIDKLIKESHHVSARS